MVWVEKSRDMITSWTKIKKINVIIDLLWGVLYQVVTQRHDDPLTTIRLFHEALPSPVIHGNNHDHWEMLQKHLPMLYKGTGRQTHQRHQQKHGP